MDWLRNSWGALFSKAPKSHDGRPTPRQLSKIEKMLAIKTKRRKSWLN